ncbi:MAG: ribbon-helix-helix protein, CopG family [Vicinamibacteria bacterium]
MPSKKTNKTSVRLPLDLYRRLEQVAGQQGRPIGEVIRDAVEIQYGEGGLTTRLRAIGAWLEFRPRRHVVKES